METIYEVFKDLPLGTAVLAIMAFGILKLYSSQQKINEEYKKEMQKLINDSKNREVELQNKYVEYLQNNNKDMIDCIKNFSNNLKENTEVTKEFTVIVRNYFSKQ